MRRACTMDAICLIAVLSGHDNPERHATPGSARQLFPHTVVGHEVGRADLDAITRGGSGVDTACAPEWRLRTVCC